MTEISGISDALILAHAVDLTKALIPCLKIEDRKGVSNLLCEMVGAVKMASTAVKEDASHVKPPLPTAKQIRDSIGPDAVISFIDGKPYKMLKRHLRRFGMTPDEYRAKFGLPVDYPMTAPSYSAKRTEIAKDFGFGLGTGSDDRPRSRKLRVQGSRNRKPRAHA